MPCVCRVFVFSENVDRLYYKIIVLQLAVIPCVEFCILTYRHHRVYNGVSGFVILHNIAYTVRRTKIRRIDPFVRHSHRSNVISTHTYRGIRGNVRCTRAEQNRVKIHFQRSTYECANSVVKTSTAMCYINRRVVTRAGTAAGGNKYVVSFYMAH